MAKEDPDKVYIEQLGLKNEYHRQIMPCVIERLSQLGIRQEVELLEAYKSDLGLFDLIYDPAFGFALI